MATSVLDLILRSRKQGDAARKTKGDLKGIEDQSKKTSKGLSRLQKAARVAAVAGLALLSAAAVKFAKDSVDAASGVEEMRSKFNVVFGKEAPRAVQELDEFGESVGRSTFQLMEMASTLQDTFVPLGFSRKAAADLSIELTKLATDVASFNNASDADVIRDFQSALVGNHETVRKYGIVITEATLKQEAYQSGLAELGDELTNQEKVQARLNLITEGTSDAQGDAARTSESFENQSKALEAAILDLQVAYGEGLIPTLQAGMPWLREVIGGMADQQEAINLARFEAELYGAEVLESMVGPMVRLNNGTIVTVERFRELRQETRESGEEMRAIKSAGLAAGEGLDAVSESASFSVDSLEDYTTKALGARIVTERLRQATEDGFISAAELEGIQSAADTFGIDMPDSLEDAVDNFNTLSQMGVDPATADLETLEQAALDVRSAINRLPAEKTIRINMEIGDMPEGVPEGGGSQVTVPHGVTGAEGQFGRELTVPPGVTGEEGQFGLDMTVPPGFFENFNVRASSGERVIVQTPEQQRRGETVAGQPAPGGPRQINNYITIGSELEGRAFIERQNRALSRWA